MRFALVTLCCALVAGCVFPRMATFNEAEYAPYAQPGTGSISGQAFLKTRGGEVKYGAGNEIYLNPVTTYSTEWFQETVLNNRRLKPADSRTDPFHWVTSADGQGNFQFENLPAGEYYVACVVAWQVDGWTTGDWVHARVAVREGEHVERVILRPSSGTRSGRIRRMTCPDTIQRHHAAVSFDGPIPRR